MMLHSLIKQNLSRTVAVSAALNTKTFLNLTTIPSPDFSVTNNAYDIDNEFVNSNAKVTNQSGLYKLFFFLLLIKNISTTESSVIKFDFEKHSIGKIIHTK